MCILFQIDPRYNTYSDLPLSGLLDASYGGLDSTQFFVERPESNVTAREGEDVLLKCRVGNLQGKVQWTRNGFAMGTSCKFQSVRGEGCVKSRGGLRICSDKMWR